MEKGNKKDENIRSKYILRFLANILILSILAGSGYLIYYVVRRSEKFLKHGMDNYSWWERNEVRIL